MHLFAKNKEELDSLLQTIRIYSQNTGMEYIKEEAKKTIDETIKPRKEFKKKLKK